MKHALTLFTALLFAPLTAFTRQRNPLRMIFVSLSLLMVCLAGSGNAMTFKPREVHQWDTWVFYHDQTYYLYYLIGSQWQGWDGVGVATSKDGVHWEERGTPIMKRDNANWLGTGSTWRSPKFAKDGRFIVNFSEQPKGEAQHIYFAESRDLLKWDRLPIEFRQDARWYEEKGRWDCIYPVARPAGGFYGYWTATPKGRVGFGFGESEDGVNWTALPAPELDWKTNVAPKSCEIGAVEKIGDKYYAMVSVYPDMLTFVAKQPQGPFVAAPKNFRLLVGNCYFARFFPSPDGLLVTHHSITKTKRGRLSVCYPVPLKRADVDAEGTLRLVWWRGNETLKGQATKPRIQNTDSAIAPAFLESAVDVCRGTMLEGSVNFKQAPGFVFESAGGTLTAIRLLSATATEAGPIQPDGTKFTALPGHSINRDLPTKPTSRWSLLFRHSLVELYLDDVLFNVLSLPEAATGRIGFLNNASGISDLKACTMTLPDEASPSAVPVAIQSAAKYNAVIKSQDKAVFGKAALELRRWMELHDPQRPVYHTMGPEAFTFDVNGPTYHDGRYHLFYLNQGGETKVCRRGHLTSPDLVHWEDWPVAMWPDTPWDHEAVFSGNLVIDDKGIPTFIYTGNSTHKTAKGVVARSDDGMLTWRKKLVMDTPPYPGTPVHWDGQLWKDGGTWYQLCGGTYTNAGAAVLWSSPDLENWTYRNRIFTSGKYGGFWELPYLLPFGDKHVLIIGVCPVRYWIGTYDNRKFVFTPDREEAEVLDVSRHFYAPNPHMTDNKGPGGSERRLMFGWVRGGKSPTQGAPYWDGNHSLPRVLTVENGKLRQEPIPELSCLRHGHRQLTARVIESAAPGLLNDFTGDALEIIATFESRDATAKRFGVKLRLSKDGNERVEVYYEPATGRFGVAGTVVDSAISDKADFLTGQKVSLHIFLDRSVVEVFAAGRVITRRAYCKPDNQGLDIFSDGGRVKLESLDVWRMKSIWK